MCNTKNTELIRQQLWCDVYTELVKDVNSFEPSNGANIAVSEFDKAFQVCIKKCGNTEPYNDICLNCGSSLIDVRINDPS